MSDNAPVPNSDAADTGSDTDGSDLVEDAVPASDKPSSSAKKGLQPAPFKNAAPKADAKESKVATAPERKKFKLKIDGADEDWEGTDEDIQRELQLSKASRKRMQEASETKKAALELFESIKKDPFEAFKDPELGIDLMEMAKKRLLQQYEEEQLKAQDPKEYERKELQRKLDEREARLKEIEDREKNAEQERKDSEVRSNMEKTFLEALDKSGLPKNRHTLMEMANVARINFAKGLELTPDEMARETQERLDGNAQRYISAFKGEQLISKLGPDVVKEVLRHELAKAKAKRGEPKPEPKPVVAEKPESDEPRTQRRGTPSELKKLWRGY